MDELGIDFVDAAPWFGHDQELPYVLVRVSAQSVAEFSARIGEPLRRCYITDAELDAAAHQHGVTRGEILRSKLPDAGSTMSGDFGEVLGYFYQATRELPATAIGPKKWRLKQDRTKPAPKSDVASGTRLLPLDLLREPLAPHTRFSQRILLALQALEFIEPELTRSHAADWLFARDWIQHGFTSLGWRVLRPAPKLDGPIRELADVLDRFDAVDSALPELVALWEDLALAETAEFAQSALSRSGYDPRWADDAAPALRQALEHFSAGQVMYLVHISLRSVALTHQRGSVPTVQLGHVLSTSIADYTQRAIAERWTIRGMVRAPDRPRSSIAALFADTVTGLSAAYLAERPCLEALVRALVSRHTVH